MNAFYAYPSRPASVPDTIGAAIEELNNAQTVDITPWEKLKVGGKIVIDQIAQAIDASPLFLADLTGLNPNVMFELGYAIVSKKRLWLTYDDTLVEAKKDFAHFRLLTTIGYRPSANAHSIVAAFYKDQPFADLTDTVFSKLIAPHMGAARAATLLYLKNLHDTEALFKMIRKKPFIKRYLGMFKMLTRQRQLVCHMSSPVREGTRIHTARQAFICGMAYGLKKKLLILEEGDFLTPLDYRDLTYHYTQARSVVTHLDGWLPPVEAMLLAQAKPSSSFRPSTDLKHLQLGDYVAENESQRLIDYFVETAAYREALAGSHTISIGRKGSGKTANFYKLASVFENEKGTIVCVIKPPAYQLEALLKLFKNYQDRDAKSYLIESLWKFLLLTEIAIAIIERAENNQTGTTTDEERDLQLLSQKYPAIFKLDFAVRLEQCIADLLTMRQQGAGSRGIEDVRVGISEALHQTMLKDLRIALGRAIGKDRRVAIVVDNLDKAWDKEVDIPELGKFLLGILTAAGRLPAELRHQDSRRESINVSLALFLRSDIFYKINRLAAREPDKIRFHKLSWKDHELLLRVLEERFIASSGGQADVREFWECYFCPTVKGLSTPDYLVSRILPRPRDLVFFARAAVDVAIDRGHGRVEEPDVIEAEKRYSQYAFESILVENGISAQTLENILFEFAGSNSRLNENEVRSAISTSVATEQIESIVEHLARLTFLGVEGSDGEFRYSDDPEEFRKNLILARKLAEKRDGNIRFEINVAFHAYLEIRAN
ncbi:MAG: P-loop ATPase, Sll1717 family [Gemmataceae bacterium]